jgi:galactokinase
MVCTYYAYKLPFQHPFTISRGTKTHQPTLIVVLEHKGLRGYGEAPAIAYYHIPVEKMIYDLETKKTMIEGFAPTDPERYWHYLHHLLPDNPFLVCALDMAAWDLYGQVMGRPLYELWGLDPELGPPTDYTIGIDTIDKMVEKMEERPWPIYKIKLGVPDDLEIVGALRRHTDAVLRVDANSGWTLEEALQKIPRLAELGVEFVEQPLPREDWAGMKVLFDRSPLPLIADESCIHEEDVDKCHDHFHGINIKLTKCSGLTPARRMIARARTLGMKVMVGSMNESSIGSAAIAHLLPALDYVDMDGPLLLGEDVAMGLVFQNGKAIVPRGPGLGVKFTGLYSHTSAAYPRVAAEVKEKFVQVFNRPPSLTVRSPGRVNLIGEHTDYNHGYVMPAAIDKAIYMSVDRRTDQEIHLCSLDLGQTFKGDIGNIAISGLHWPDYILGVVAQLLSAGYAIGGFDCVFGGDIPQGAGMSSSAAIECATAFALNKLFTLELDPLTMVKLSQKAENDFVGVQSGIMDQFASMFGRRDHVIRLDCQSLDYTYFPFRLDGIRIVLLDTHVKHSLTSSEYNTRREQCDAGVRIIRRHVPGVNSLRDVTSGMLSAYVLPEDELIYRRCSYVIEENQRALAAAEDLQRNDLRAFGQKMYASHEGLSRKYEVSCPELDFLVRQVRGDEAVLGARMMGGGFGGCTINLVKEAAIEGLITRVAPLYRVAMGRELSAYIGRIENGTSIL